MVPTEMGASTIEPAGFLDGVGQLQWLGHWQKSGFAVNSSWNVEALNLQLSDAQLDLYFSIVPRSNNLIGPFYKIEF